MFCQLCVKLYFQCCQHKTNEISGRHYCTLHFDIHLQIGIKRDVSFPLTSRGLAVNRTDSNLKTPDTRK
jgi:hypothetical protein